MTQIYTDERQVLAVFEGVSRVFAHARHGVKGILNAIKSSFYGINTYPDFASTTRKDK